MVRNKLGIGIVGCGGISGSHIAALGRLVDQACVVAVSNPVEAAGRRRQEESGAEVWYPDYHALLADDRIDAAKFGSLS